MKFRKMNQMMRFFIVSTAITLCIEQTYVDSFTVPINHRSTLHESLLSSPPLPSSSLSVHNVKRTQLFASQIGEESKSAPPIESDKTLYEILNSTPTCSRSELKRNYIKLVRQTHPDALIAKGDTEMEDENPEFQVIMQAWRTLSDPFERKRYDRSLRAKAFTAKVETVVGTIGKTAGPQFLNAFENVAIPFLRRGAATTVAGFTSISEDLANYGSAKEENTTATNEETGIGGIIANAVKSSQKAGKAIDHMELTEKSRQLNKRSRKEEQRAIQMKEELDSIMNKRVRLSLHTPNTKLNSLEALMILDGMNTIDEVGMADIIRFRHTVSYEVEKLQEFESDLESSRELNRNLQRDKGRKMAALEQAKANAKAAEQAEERARKALEDAINLVASTTHDVSQSTLSLENTHDKLRYNDIELDKITTGMTKQQEKVRVALRRKEEAMQQADEKFRGDFKARRIEDSSETIQELAKEERYLRAESARLDSIAERLSSRARKLQINADVLEKEENKAWEALEEEWKALEIAGEATKDLNGKSGKIDKSDEPKP